MSEPILMALVQLFAMVAASVRKQVSGNSRKILESYLRQHLNNLELEEYLKLFDELVFFHQPLDETILTVDLDISDKIREICVKIYKQLSTRDRVLVFIKFVEFLHELAGNEDGEPGGIGATGENYLEIMQSVFNTPDQEFKDVKSFVLDPSGSGIHPENLMVVDGNPSDGNIGFKHLFRERLDKQLLILHVPSIRTFLCRYLGNDDLYLNGNNIPPFRAFILSNGSILKNLKIAPVYYTDVASRFLQTREKIRLNFTAKEIEYHFKNSSNGLQAFSFTAGSGELIGVMGGSGVGKSTLLNILNGNMSPDQGQILINGYDLEKDKEKLHGVIGFVPQDDLLVEELTVFQNLYFNAELCFRDFGKKKLIRTVMKVLADIGLIGIKSLKVGDPLNKFISGGQRKRLNIALELIREPAVLFADEPTSGLSSMDSEMVMLLLKEQTLKGKLVIVNIHQPSSDIFKLFDKLLIMDKGGYPIYYGNPIDALTYFKTRGNYVNPTESECVNCGYVNPEQLLQITEAKIISEYGKVTGNRKISPVEWYHLFRKNIQPGLMLNGEKQELPKSHFRIPGQFKQFRIFSLRNLLTKITNRQYMFINLLEAPFLAALLAYLTRYFPGDHYVFGENRNLVAYLFMSVVVSLFLGMMVSAEEIIKDRRILKREAFLNLSRFSYLNSKILLLFVLSAIQTILYVQAGNWILGIKGMTLSYWLILFSTSCFANMVGLNISAGLNSVVAIYILIPFILVPQLLLSGTIVAFDNLNPGIASREHVPLVGNMMTSRWTFEALAVTQFKNNKYERIFYPYDKEISRYGYLTAYAIPTLQSELDVCRLNLVKNQKEAETKNLFDILNKEIPALQKEAGFGSCPLQSALNIRQFNDSVAEGVQSFLDSLSRYFSDRLSLVSLKRDAVFKRLAGQLGYEGVFKLKQEFYNNSLADLVLDKAGENKILEGKGKLIRKKDPVFMEPLSHTGNAHFYAPEKNLFGWKVDTLWFNFAVIWLMSLLLYFTLLFDLIRKPLEYFEKLKFRK